MQRCEGLCRIPQPEVGGRSLTLIFDLDFSFFIFDLDLYLLCFFRSQEQQQDQISPSSKERIQECVVSLGEDAGSLFSLNVSKFIQAMHTPWNFFIILS